MKSAQGHVDTTERKGKGGKGKREGKRKKEKCEVR